MFEKGPSTNPRDTQELPDPTTEHSCSGHDGPDCEWTIKHRSDPPQLLRDPSSTHPSMRSKDEVAHSLGTKQREPLLPVTQRRMIRSIPAQERTGLCVVLDVDVHAHTRDAQKDTPRNKETNDAAEKDLLRHNSPCIKDQHT